MTPSRCGRAAYAEFGDEEWAAAEVARLTELHLAAQQARVEIMLRTGGAAQATPVAEVLTRRQPLREESWRLLALALWAGQRQADALAALRRARAVLRTELGLDPGPALTELEGAILAQRADVLRSAPTGGMYVSCDSNQTMEPRMLPRSPITETCRTRALRDAAQSLERFWA